MSTTSTLNRNLAEERGLHIRAPVSSTSCLQEVLQPFLPSTMPHARLRNSADQGFSQFFLFSTATGLQQVSATFPDEQHSQARLRNPADQGFSSSSHVSSIQAFFHLSADRPIKRARIKWQEYGKKDCSLLNFLFFQHTSSTFCKSGHVMDEGSRAG